MKYLSYIWHRQWPLALCTIPQYGIKPISQKSAAATELHTQTSHLHLSSLAEICCTNFRGSILHLDLPVPLTFTIMLCYNSICD